MCSCKLRTASLCLRTQPIYACHTGCHPGTDTCVNTRGIRSAVRSAMCLRRVGRRKQRAEHRTCSPSYPVGSRHSPACGACSAAGARPGRPGGGPATLDVTRVRPEHAPAPTCIPTRKSLARNTRAVGCPRRTQRTLRHSTIGLGVRAQPLYEVRASCVLSECGVCTGYATYSMLRR